MIPSLRHIPLDWDQDEEITKRERVPLSVLLPSTRAPIHRLVCHAQPSKLWIKVSLIVIAVEAVTHVVLHVIGR